MTEKKTRSKTTTAVVHAERGQGSLADLRGGPPGDRVSRLGAPAASDSKTRGKRTSRRIDDPAIKRRPFEAEDMLPIFSHGAHWLTAEEVMLRLKEDRGINLRRLEFAKEDMDSTVAKPIPWKGITKAEELVTGHVLVYPIRGRNFVMLTFAIVIDASEEERRAGAPGTWPPQWVAEMEAAVAPRGSRGRRKL